jgi:hypothetical protein
VLQFPCYCVCFLQMASCSHYLSEIELEEIVRAYEVKESDNEDTDIEADAN